MRQYPSQPRVVLIAVLSLAAVSLVVAACAGNSQAPTTALPVQAGPPVTQIGGVPLLPAPASLPAPTEPRKDTSYLPEARLKPGSNFHWALPSERVEGTAGIGYFSPACEPGSPDFAGLAYAMYQFSLLGYDEEPVVSLEWVDPPANAEDCYLGLSNWERNCWDWYRPGADWSVEFADLADLLRYLDANGRCVVVLALAGEAPSQLNWLRLGGRVGYWHKQTAYSDSAISWPSMALDAKDKPHVAFLDRGADGLRYCWFSGTAWDSELVGDFALGGSNPALVLDAAGQPHIAHQNWAGGNVLYSYKTATGWAARIVAEGCDSSAYPALAVTPEGTPLVSYYQSSTVKVKLSIGMPTLWLVVELEEGCAAGSRTTIARGSDGIVHVCYYDGTAHEVHYAAVDGLTAVQSVLPVSDVDSYPYMAMGPAGELVVALHTNLPDCSLQLGRLTDGSWDFAAFPAVCSSSEDEVGGYCSLLIAPDGRPHLAYSEEGGLSLWYARHTGVDWQRTHLDSLSLNPTTSICLDSRGRPWVAYTDDDYNELYVVHMLD